VSLPVPYYSDPHVALYHGDCLDLLPHVGEVDHVITDPPYEAEAHTKARRQRRDGTVGVLAIDFDRLDERTRDAAASHFVRLSRGWALVFCQIEAVGDWRRSFDAAGAKWARGQTWVKPDSAPQFTGDRPGMGHESIATAWCGDGRMRWNGGGRRGVYTHPVNVFGGSPNEHPTTKPLSLMRELVLLFTDPGDLILDPFAGSGTTGLAARLEGRRAILIEREERYAEVAARRLERMPQETAAGQQALFAGGKP
jgi:site-specific DNA-methyltransferase (adenine-specific)